MATVASIIEFVEGLTGHRLNGDEGVQYGPADREVNRLVLCWLATAAALDEAGRSGADLVLAHESLFYPYDSRLKPGEEQPWEKWPTNRQRMDVMDRFGLTVLRVHGSLDEICIFDDFAALLDLGAPVEAEGLVKIYEIPPCSLGDLVARVKQRIGLARLRVSAPKGFDQQVHRVGLPWGGVGLFVNVGYQETLVEKHCDALIAGESDNYGARFASELGIPMIETDHEVSENPGLRHFAEKLRERFPEVATTFYECPRVWEIV